MAKGMFEVPFYGNEPVYSYAPGSPEREELKKKLDEMYNQDPIDIPMYLGDDEVRTNDKREVICPHETKKVVGHFNYGTQDHAKKAIDEALKAKKEWAELPWEHRASIFLRAADLLAGPYRQEMNAATMLGQSKSVHQSEIDAVVEFIDFLRYNVVYMQDLYQIQPESPSGVWNRNEFRPLEGFVFCITPFNFTSIAGNLPAAPALMGNVCIWKPAESQIFSAEVIMKVFREAGLPPGVINFLTMDGPEAGEIIFNHEDFAGLHFTGSTKVFRSLWKIMGENIEKYKSYPRIVGETGGKDFIFAHKSSKVKELATAITRGAFEFQGQKCSAVSRCYIPNSIWDETRKHLLNDVKSIGMGSPLDFSNFFNAVVNRQQFDKISGYIDYVKEHSDEAEIIAGGNYDDSEGYFIEPTVVVAKDPHFKTMEEEIFGPVVTIYVYDDDKYEEMLEVCDNTSPYGLTGAIFAQDRYAVDLAMKKLENSAGNFYINDKPTGAVVGNQPFGGARQSGTNDKAGSLMNLLRWVSTRTIKENFVPPKDYRYPFMG